MKLYLHIAFIIFSSWGSLFAAVVDQALIDNVWSMTSPNYKRGTHFVSRAVQAVNMLAHELQLYSNEAKATAAAKSIVAMVTTGKGVKGGLRGPSSKRRLANETEKKLMIDAVTKAVDYLQKQSLFDDVLRESLSEMLGTWNTDDVTRKHGSVVMGLLLASSKKTKRHDLASAKALVPTLIPDSALWIRTSLAPEAASWHYAQEYMEEPYVDHLYNAIELKRIQKAQADELVSDPVYSARIAAMPEDISSLESLTVELERTLIPEKALALAEKLRTIVKSLDLKTIKDNAVLFPRVIRALVAIEKFRMFEINLGGLDKADPTVIDYKNDALDPESQAILITLVSAIQNYLYNPGSTIDDLRQLFLYRKNDKRLERVVAALNAIKPDEFVNYRLLAALQRPIAINVLQYIAIDEVNLKQRLRYYAMPRFHKETKEIDYVLTFLRDYGSSGVLMQCGFFSLGYESRNDAFQQILDNLNDPRIFGLADWISARSGDISAAMNWLSMTDEQKDKAIADRKLKPDDAKRVRENYDKDVLEIKRVFKEKYSLQALGDAVLVARMKLSYQRVSDDIQRRKEIFESEKTKRRVAAGFTPVVPNEILIGIWLQYQKKHGLDVSRLNPKEICFRVEQEKTNLQRYLNDLLPPGKSATLTFKKDEERNDVFDRGGQIAGAIDIIKSVVSKEILDKADKILSSLTDQLLHFLENEEMERALMDSEVTRIFYTVPEFQKFIREDMHKFFAQGDSGKVGDVGGYGSGELLEFPPNPSWAQHIPSYPFLMSVLNNWNIGAWTSKHYLRVLQAGRIAEDIIRPIHATEDNEYLLTSEMYNTPSAKTIDVVNLGGGHFEKLVISNDYSRSARSIRHKALYNLSNTRP